MTVILSYHRCTMPAETFLAMCWPDPRNDHALSTSGLFVCRIIAGKHQVSAKVGVCLLTCMCRLTHPAMHRSVEASSFLPGVH